MSRTTPLLLMAATLLFSALFGFAPQAEASTRTCHHLFRTQRGYTGLLQNAARVYVISELKKVLPPGMHEAYVDGKLRRVLVAYDMGSAPGTLPHRIAAVTVRISDRDVATTESKPLERIAADGSPGTRDDAEFSRKARFQLLADNRVLIANDLTNGHPDHAGGLLVTNLGLEIDLRSFDTGGDRIVNAVYYQDVRTVSTHMPNKTQSRKSTIQILVKQNAKSSK